MARVSKFRKVRAALSVGPRPYSIQNPADLSSLHVVHRDPAVLGSEWLAALVAAAEQNLARGSHYEPIGGGGHPLRYLRML